MSRDISQVLKCFNVQCCGIVVAHLRLDSRQVNEGDAFVALRGHQQNGEDYILSALERGAVCVLIDESSEVEVDVDETLLVRVPNLNAHIAKIAAQFYQYPSTQMCTVGVTGTNGKSTTTTMIANLAKQCEHPSAIIGTLGYGQPESLTPLANTTPSNIDLQRILAQLAQVNKLVAMEVSSHGLVQGRLNETTFDVAVFTNLSRDHLDYHTDMASYAEAKLSLFQHHQPKFSVLNADDEYTQQWLNKYSFNNLVVYGKKPQSHAFKNFVWFDDVKCDALGFEATISSSWGKGKLRAPLYGLFNIYNLTAAVATLLTQGFALDKLLAAAERLQPVAGRMQAFRVANKPTCIVDYAHTPEALELALQALQQHVPGNVMCVFGCGGDRDKGKRPLMAQAVERNADQLVITSDNPRSEDPKQIIDDVKAGLSNPQYAVCKIDRAEAIRYAIEHTPKDGVVLVAGKGHEDYQIIGDQRLPFCDRRYVEAVLREKSA
ncbi:MULTISPECIES: UDP-N-acetylmuramoyl-L-alanyl-D-glutamate--2,6-diaminopimelate ligase [Pseudoalteromonas]|uniref:UDP-N-acetylmuramoyl-L-alanyl-D-glutamate--2,6-diaminopimelate ligase n=1 Tax=Pseudoalteromonas amylolytica TaxID=1859457 RepID=A0A1S1MV59_9GAMM|nr:MULTISPECIES: UDP-N-acetylmuramoyl-L-alanyl-D-glutamate--2,6-diaminopimelate ligase [Pseudoalteromonas]OHU90730.1 UDP-N-acetylmuramoyl-L-alanyl-D-glutamate--2,6-diaminopimelate ligase [Pseudoalteromonas sp. JW3]OHU92650.1 UDP-N-acetylmuramoyl-L-alanyl-D-glutamate--2,6-diaminopimelate ligase [Pseudoalteromonas amylolytica]